MEVLSEHNCQGWLEGYLLTGRHGLFATYEAFAMVSASMVVQHAKWLEEGVKLPWRKPIPSLNILLTSTCWRNDHNGFSHQGPGLIDVMLSKKGDVSRIYLPPDANCLLSVADHCFRSRNYVNLIVIDKQPQLQWLDMDAAQRALRARRVGLGLGEQRRGRRAGRGARLRRRRATLETRRGGVAPAQARAGAPRARRQRGRPHGALRPATAPPRDGRCRLRAALHRQAPVVFAFHGYQRAVHELVHGRANAERFHVRGFIEEGTTTTPFDMVVKNGMSRYHLCLDALRYAQRLAGQTQALADHCTAMLRRHETYIREHLEDMPEVRDWTWTAL